MIVALLILHGLVAFALLGSLTHQLASTARGRFISKTEAKHGRDTFAARYVKVRQDSFVGLVAGLYVANIVLGGLIYPAYRLDVRIPFEEMGMFWAVGLFEVKEHWGGIGLGCIPLYLHVWRARESNRLAADRLAVTALLTVIVWTGFIAGHLLNNIRGL